MYFYGLSMLLNQQRSIFQLWCFEGRGAVAYHIIANQELGVRDHRMRFKSSTARLVEIIKAWDLREE